MYHLGFISTEDKLSEYYLGVYESVDARNKAIKYFSEEWEGKWQIKEGSYWKGRFVEWESLLNEHLFMLC